MADNQRDIQDSPAFKELKMLLMKIPCERREALAGALYEFATAERKTQFTSPPEIAARLGVTSTTVRRWILEGRIQAKKIGPRRWLVPISELERLLSMSGKP